MNSRPEQIAHWQERLADTFRGPSGIIGERVTQLYEAERIHGSAMVPQSHGFTHLMDAFQDFAIQTVTEAFAHQITLNAHKVVLGIVTFKRFRAAYTTFWRGYYFDAAAMLRTVFENDLYFAAALNGYISISAMWDALRDVDLAKMPPEQAPGLIAKHQRSLDAKVAPQMYGSKSGLSKEDQAELRILFSNLHAHVHKAQSEMVFMLVDMAQKKAAPSLFPTLNMHNASLFCNVAVCAGWAFLRCLPFISDPKLYSTDWHKRYHVLDESFGFYVASWEKPIGPAFCRFMKQKLGSRWAIHQGHQR